MTQRINKASQKRIEKALRSSYTLRSREAYENRAEALSTVKRVKLVQG